MIKMPSVFASNALFQHSNTLTLRGTASGKLSAGIIRADGTVFDSTAAECGENGAFALTLKTPAASFEKYRIILRDSDDERALDNILFGELWLASGQSNMELENFAIDGFREYIDSLKGLPLRIYLQNELDNAEQLNEGPMPMEPEDTLNGVWGEASDMKVARCASALGTAFIKKLYLRYKQAGRDIPMGFVSCSVGATRIESWLPYSDLEDDDGTAHPHENKPDPETWNSFGWFNFLQSTALYNRKICALQGLKFYSIVWYQGESNIDRPGAYERYKRYLRRYYNTYSRLFAADSEFRVVMAMLCPYSYGSNSECKMTAINNAISDMAHECPEHFTAVPSYDLPQVWGVDPFYHPIHPTNKYPFGERIADAYADGITAPTFAFAAQDGKRLLLRFNDLNGELHTDGERVYGLYIRGEDTPYMEAECEIIDGEMLAAYHPYIERPVHAAYQAASLAQGGNLCGGALPVAQFCTEDPWTLELDAKPWLFTEKPESWVFNCNGDIAENDYYDCGMRPNWMPLSGSEICVDRFFKKRIASLRICGETNIFGAYFKSRRYSELDLQKYAGIRFMLFNANAVSRGGGSVRMEIRFRPERNGEYIVTRRAFRLNEPDFGWAEFALPFGKLPDDKIVSAALVFDTGANLYHFVCIDDLHMVPNGTEMPSMTENTEEKASVCENKGPARPAVAD